MRHLKSGRQLGRNSSHRKAMFRNMVVSLLDHESITTTDAKAKELRRYADKLITLGKRGTLHARRRARVMANDKEVLQKLFTTLAERYKDRPGGYTRIVKLGLRPGDSAPLSVIQLVEEEMPKRKKSAKKGKAAKKEGAPDVTEAATPAKAKVEEPVAKEVAEAKEDVEPSPEEPPVEVVEESGEEAK